VGDQDIGSPSRPVSSELQVPGEPFPSWYKFHVKPTGRITVLYADISIERD
jgi:hypothetical protein